MILYSYIATYASEFRIMRGIAIYYSHTVTMVYMKSSVLFIGAFQAIKGLVLISSSENSVN